jgi:hypothetical protein
MKGKKTGGRALGTPNKATRQIKEVIASIVNVEELVKTLYKLTRGKNPNVLAIRLLLEYSYGKPAQMLSIKAEQPMQKKLLIIFDEADEKNGSIVDENRRIDTNGKVL